MCRSAKFDAQTTHPPRVHEVRQQDNYGEAFLGVVIESVSSNPWSVNLQIGGILVKFKIDTGADVTVIPETVYGN